jgi:1A family penicillin-binding protein
MGNLHPTLVVCLDIMVRVGDTVLLLVSALSVIVKAILHAMYRLGSFEYSLFEKGFASTARIWRTVTPILKNLKQKAFYAFNHLPLRRKRKVGRPRKTKTSKLYHTPFLYKVKFFAVGVVFSFLFLFMPVLVFIFTSDLPDPYKLSANAIPKTTKIYDRNNVLLYEIYANQNRTIVKLTDIPSDLQKATIAIEDKDFYSHPGFDIRGIARAAYSNAQNNDLQGGSTLTQQLIKSAFLTPSPTLQRKVKEIILAFWAERIYTKNQILELYFNYVPYGGTAWGIQAASEVYFGKQVQDLTLAESAFLAGMPKAPSIYSPYANEGNTLWKKRQKEVLNAMTQEGYISKKEAEEAAKVELSFKEPNVPLRAPHFVMHVRKLLVEKYGLSEVERGGLRIVTTLDFSLQEKVQRVVHDEVVANEYLLVSNGAAVVTEPGTGEILAMVGSRDYFDQEHDGNVNLTTQSRQPGSTVKLITYAQALMNGMTEASIIEDAPLAIRTSDGRVYAPVNYDGTYRGRIPLRLAFANSLNTTAVRVAQQVGVDAIVNLGTDMGITTWDDPKRYGLSITLGGAEATMVDLATVFGTVANSGKRVDLDPFLEIKNSEGEVVYEARAQPKQVLSEGVAFILSDILADNNARSLAFGTNSILNIPGRRVSVKTGTSDNKKDNWTVGYTPDYVVATWVGNNDGTPMSQNLASGITGAAPMWSKIMTSLLANEASGSAVQVPDSVVRKNCFGRTVFFVRGTENSTACPTSYPLPTRL